ncbi:exosome complex component RRP41 isoform [Arachis hypogaea]|nr:exosome complex component RRP41 isoform [Arachis hypogaea]
MEYVSPEGLRLDGRRPMEMRQIRAEIGAVSRADGSAIFEMGNTKVVAAVYGPREVQNRSQQMSDQALIRCEYSMANFSTGDRKRKPKGDRRSTEISMVIRQTMEACIMTHLMPRSQIDIYVQVLQADGGTRSACINAATLALSDAGIPMCDLVTSCSAGYLNSTPLLDLNYVEDSAGGPDVTVGILPKLDKVTLLQQLKAAKQLQITSVKFYWRTQSNWSIDGVYNSGAEVMCPFCYLPGNILACGLPVKQEMQSLML